MTFDPDNNSAIEIDISFAGSIIIFSTFAVVWEIKKNKKIDSASEWEGRLTGRRKKNT